MVAYGDKSSDVIIVDVGIANLDEWYWVSSTAEFMLHKLHMEESEVPRMCLELYREHGTTMAGLKVKTVLPQLP